MFENLYNILYGVDTLLYNVIWLLKRLMRFYTLCECLNAVSEVVYFIL